MQADYAGRELISMLEGMVELNKVHKKKCLSGNEILGGKSFL